MFLTQALGQENLTDSTQLMVVVNNLYDITGDEQYLLKRQRYPDHAK